jgi:hypothetical protein
MAAGTPQGESRMLGEASRPKEAEAQENLSLQSPTLLCDRLQVLQSGDAIVLHQLDSALLILGGIQVNEGRILIELNFEEAVLGGFRRIGEIIETLDGCAVNLSNDKVFEVLIAERIRGWEDLA